MPPLQNEPLMGPFNGHYDTIPTYLDPQTVMFTDEITFYPDRIAVRGNFNTNREWYTESATTIGNDYVTKEQLAFEIDFILKKIYKVISEHKMIDITEEEFMDLLKE